MLADKADEQDKLLSNRRRLALELRRLRDRAGLSGRQLAKRISISQSKVSRIESGLTIPTGPEVAAWAAAVSASGTAAELLTMLTDAVYTEVHPWDAALREQVHLQDEIQEIENRAGMELTYEPTVVPGLLQTAEYARRVFTMFEPAYAALDILAVVAGRLHRQAALFDPARRFSFLVTEGALRWRAGPAHAILSQLDRIASLSTLENVSIGLIAHAAPARTHSPHGFVIFEPADRDGDALVMVETVHANLTVSDPVHVALYRRQWSLLEEMAVFGDTARELLAVITADIRLLPAEEDPMRLRAGRIPGSRSAAGNLGPQGPPGQPNRTCSADFTSRSSSCGQEPSRIRRRKSAYSCLLNTNPGWYGFFESRITTAPATRSTTTHPPPPLQANSVSGQMDCSLITDSPLVLRARVCPAMRPRRRCRRLRKPTGSTVPTHRFRPWSSFPRSAAAFEPMEGASSTVVHFTFNQNAGIWRSSVWSRELTSWARSP